jgi:hypothetical protein
MPVLETFGPGMSVYRYSEQSKEELEQLQLRPKIDFRLQRRLLHR